ncbi:MAG: tetratricopeptide repeat protein [Vicinamibacterales bacterium]
MAFDRVAVLRQAEKLVRQGRLDQAIVEYARVVDDQPRDWATANMVGDLLVRAGRVDEAVAQFARCAETLRLLGFLPKAAAVYKKVLNLRPDDDFALVQAGEVAAAQGLTVDARQFLVAAAEHRRSRGDLAGAEQVRSRLETLVTGVARRAGPPADAATASHIARDAAGGVDRDPALLFALAEMRLRTGDVTAGLAVIEALVARHEPSVSAAADLSARLAVELHDETGFELADRVASVCAAREDWPLAVRTLRRFMTARPLHAAGLQRLLDLCAKGGLIDEGLDAQRRYFDALLAERRVEEARVLAAALIRDRPDLAEQTARLRAALVAAGAPDIEPDAPQAAQPAGNSGLDSTPENDEIDEIDLSALLDGLPSGSDGVPQDANLDDVFKQLRDEAEGDRSPEAAEVAFQRGKALYDAGALDDCVEPLKNGARLPERRFAAASALAQLFQARGQIADSVRWLGIAADAPGLDPVDRHRTMLDLADLLERIGETAGALAVSLELHAEAGDYRDVSTRIARLAARQVGG